MKSAIYALSALLLTLLLFQAFNDDDGIDPTPTPSPTTAPTETIDLCR